MRKWSLFVLPLVTAAVMVGCQQNERQAEGPGVNLADLEPVQIVETASGQQAQAVSEAAAEPIVLIRDEADLQAMGLEELPVEADLAEQDVVLATMGEQDTGGYWVRIDGIQRLGNTLYVQATFNAPAEDATTTQALTYPFAAAVIPNVEGDVTVSPDIEQVRGQSQ
ncbi:MAG: protease complex subunit PrcB family protein [Phycisphaeraceae bacterium]